MESLRDVLNKDLIKVSLSSKLHSIDEDFECNGIIMVQDKPVNEPTGSYIVTIAGNLSLEDLMKMTCEVVGSIYGYIKSQTPDEFRNKTFTIFSNNLLNTMTKEVLDVDKINY